MALAWAWGAAGMVDLALECGKEEDSGGLGSRGREGQLLVSSLSAWEEGGSG